MWNTVLQVWISAGQAVYMMHDPGIMYTTWPADIHICKTVFVVNILEQGQSTILSNCSNLCGYLLVLIRGYGSQSMARTHWEMSQTTWPSKLVTVVCKSSPVGCVSVAKCLQWFWIHHKQNRYCILATPKRWPIVWYSQGVARHHIAIATLCSTEFFVKSWVCAHNLGAYMQLATEIGKSFLGRPFWNDHTHLWVSSQYSTNS